MNTREVNSIFEFLEAANYVTPYCDLWFRGASKFEYGLLPGLVWRNDLEFESNYINKFLVGYQAYLDKPVSNPWEQYALMGSTPILRTLQRSPIMGKRSVYVEEKKVQPGVQTRCC